MPSSPCPWGRDGPGPLGSGRDVGAMIGQPVGMNNRRDARPALRRVIAPRQAKDMVAGMPARKACRADMPQGMARPDDPRARRHGRGGAGDRPGANGLLGPGGGGEALAGEGVACPASRRARSVSPFTLSFAGIICRAERRLPEPSSPNRRGGIPRRGRVARSPFFFHEADGSARQAMPYPGFSLCVLFATMQHIRITRHLK